MKQACIFAGSSHRRLADAICERLGKQLDNADLRKFSNGETSVKMETSVRDQDVFIVQSGDGSTNDCLMELLIMINACKGGSSRSITAVMPYTPYSRQSKRKGHRGSIAARMVANLMHIAGVDHVITIDLHATPSQGFFKCPVDNLHAEPLLARWIKANVKDWQDAVVVSKNPGGTVRVTSLADALKLSFGIVTTDCRRHRPMTSGSIESSIILAQPNHENSVYEHDSMHATPRPAAAYSDAGASREVFVSPVKKPLEQDMTQSMFLGRPKSLGAFRQNNGQRPTNTSSPLVKSITSDADESDFGIPPPALDSQVSMSSSDEHEPQVSHERYDSEFDGPAESEYMDERARDVVIGRLVRGRLVEDDYPSPAISAMSFTGAVEDQHVEPADPMMSSIASIVEDRDGPDAEVSEDEEDQTANADEDSETTITLVGNVRGRPVFIVDDIIDKAGSWIAAAETVVKKGGATEVYCMASHGLFGDDALAEMQACEQIERIVVTNSFPIPDEKRVGVRKLVELDVSSLLSEAIRRNHYGEALSQLYYNQD